ncbi:MBL fold metallo-hydrolase [Oricola cellulosilytica]|uniref:MBL fold metallo-hydrolase n=1 Tax=Oricola cellulosilytica TaxID=1429082 RepID=UPI001CBCD037|nr:MBL fold metallo-hydrolase [Oricola cellulosilytica]
MKRRVILAGFGATAIFPFEAFLARPAVADVQLGSKTLTTVSDGNLVLPLEFAYPAVPRGQVVALLEAAGRPVERLEPPCNVTVLRDGDKVVLFDVGSGPNFMPSAGRLMENMDVAGISPEEVTDVVFTHAHPDHIWGLLDDFDDFVFPQAAYHINRAEWDYWRADDTLENTPEARQSFVVGARNRFDALDGVINLFDYGDEVISGVEAVDTAGHTPGHTSFAVHDDSDSVMILGDAVTNSAVSFPHPDWPSGSDQDVEMAIAARVALLDRLATEKSKLIGFHLPNGGIGRAEKAGKGYRFIGEY